MSSEPEDNVPLVALEPFRRDGSWHYTGYCESRVLIDPAWLELGDPFTCFTQLNQLAEYARKVTTPTKIELLFPPHLKPPRARVWEGAFFEPPFLRKVDPPKEPRSEEYAAALVESRERFVVLAGEFQLDASAQRSEGDVDRLLHGALLFGRAEGTQLLDLVLDHHCDYLLSENPWLLDAAEQLKKAGIWVARPEQLLELLQLSLRSAGVFIEVVEPAVDEDWGELGRLKVGTEGLGFSSFYHMENRDLRAYQQWFGRVAAGKPPAQVVNHGRAAFYHRFPFMLYAHDQVRYHALYAQRFAPTNRYRGDHRFFVAYHINAFYVMLAAILDNIAWVWSYSLDCGFREYDKSRNQCVLTHKEFRKRVGTHRPDFVALLSEEWVTKWLKHLTLKRHPAVHREPLFLTEVYEQDTGKLLSDSASVVAEADQLIVFDLLEAANNDLKLLKDFLSRMEKLPVPGQPLPGTP